MVEPTEVRGGEGVDEEPNCTTARKPGPLELTQYSLRHFQDFFGSLAAMAAAEVPAYIASMFLMEAFGRRSVLSFCQVS
jgi:hypothetical protein